MEVIKRNAFASWLGITSELFNKYLPRTEAHIFPGLQKPLISIGTLSDNNCIAVFDEKRVTIYDQTTRQIVMRAT